MLRSSWLRASTACSNGTAGSPSSGASLFTGDRAADDAVAPDPAGRSPPPPPLPLPPPPTTMVRRGVASCDGCGGEGTLGSLSWKRSEETSENTGLSMRLRCRLAATSFWMDASTLRACRSAEWLIFFICSYLFRTSFFHFRVYCVVCVCLLFAFWFS